MSDDLERRLHDAFHRGSLPSAPSSLVDGLERVPEAPVRRRRARGGRAGLGLLAAAVVLVAAGAIVVTVGSSPRPGPSTPTTAPSVAVATPGVPRLRLEFVAQPVNGVRPGAADMATIASILKARVDATGVAGGTVEAQGADRIVVELPGVTDPDPVLQRIGQTGQIDFVPLGDQPAAAGDAIDLTVHKPLFGGDGIASVRQGTDSNGAAAIDLVLKPAAAAIFADYTAGHIGNFFAIVLDGTALVAPAIQSEIPNGQVLISFATKAAPGPDQAPAIVALLQSGPLPFPLQETGSEVLDMPSPNPS